jgi:hypothetical protein
MGRGEAVTVGRIFVGTGETVEAGEREETGAREDPEGVALGATGLQADPHITNSIATDNPVFIASFPIHGIRRNEPMKSKTSRDSSQTFGPFPTRSNQCAHIRDVEPHQIPNRGFGGDILSALNNGAYP